MRSDAFETEEGELYAVQLETADLILKKAVFEDWELLFRNITGRAESAKYMLWKPDENEEAAKARMLRTIEFEKKEKYAFLVYLKSSMEPIGFAAMREAEPGVFEEMGIAVGPEYVQHGYGTQIVNTFCKEAFAQGATEFRASYRVKNLACEKMLESCGFTFDYDSEEKTDPHTGETYIVRNVKKML